MGSIIVGQSLVTVGSFFLNVTSLTCSLPSHLGFTSKLLGNDPCYLSVNNVSIWPICTSRFLSWAP